MSTVIMFPGQGSQKKGMGLEFFEQFPDVVESAQDSLGLNIVQEIEEGNNLSQTAYTQPLLFLVNHLYYLNALQEGVKADIAIGHSLGEYNALVAAGALSFEDGLRLVKVRGALMGQVKEGGMTAVIGLDQVTLETILKTEGGSAVDLANINAPNQLVISGPTDALDIIDPACKDAGAKMVVRLPVSGAFHSRYMKHVAQEFNQTLSIISFESFDIPVISNVTAQAYQQDSIADLLTQQIYSSVRWVETIQALQQKGDYQFLELGPGKVLKGLLRYF